METLAAALAQFSGAMSVDQHSLINSNVDFVTMICNAQFKRQTFVMFGKNVKRNWVRILIPK